MYDFCAFILITFLYIHVANSSNAHKKQKTRWHEINNIFLDVREKFLSNPKWKIKDARLYRDET